MNSIIQFVKKDMIYLTTSFKNWIFVIIVCGLILPLGNPMMSLVISVMGGYIFTYGLFAYEEKNKVDLLNVSLPVKRTTLCTAKYISAILYTLFGTVITTISLVLYVMMNKGFTLDSGSQFIMLMAGMTFAAGMLYSAVILPVLMYFGAIKSKYVMILGYVVGFALVSILKDTNTQLLKAIVGTKFGNYSYGLLLLISIVAYFLSYKISRQLYSHKDFK